MRRTIRKSQLKRLVEGVLNEFEFDYDKWMGLDDKGKDDMVKRYRDIENDWGDRENRAYWDKHWDTQKMYDNYRNRNIDIDPQDWPDEWYGEAGNWGENDRTSDYRWPYNDGHFTHEEDAKGLPSYPQNESSNHNLVNQITESVIRRLRGRRASRS